MTLKELKESVEKGNVLFGIKQALKNSKNIGDVFIAKDTRPETVSMLEASKIEFSVLKPKLELRKELEIDFDCEVFSIGKVAKSSKVSKSKTKKK